MVFVFKIASIAVILTIMSKKMHKIAYRCIIAAITLMHQHYSTSISLYGWA